MPKSSFIILLRCVRLLFAFRFQKKKEKLTFLWNDSNKYVNRTESPYWEMSINYKKLTWTESCRLFPTGDVFLISQLSISTQAIVEEKQ